MRGLDVSLDEERANEPLAFLMERRKIGIDTLATGSGLTRERVRWLAVTDSHPTTEEAKQIGGALDVPPTDLWDADACAAETRARARQAKADAEIPEPRGAMTPERRKRFDHSAELFANVLKANRVSIQELSRMSGLSGPFIYRLRNKQHTGISRESASALCNALATLTDRPVTCADFEWDYRDMKAGRVQSAKFPLGRPQKPRDRRANRLTADADAG